MWVLITPVYVNGKRRSTHDLRNSQPLAGQLTIVDAIDPELPGRPKRIARLRNPEHRGKDPYFGCLYDPEVISMDDKGFLLRGFDIIDIKDGRPELHVQGWLVRPTEDGDWGGRSGAR